MCTARSNEQAGRSGTTDLFSGDPVLPDKQLSEETHLKWVAGRWGASSKRRVLAPGCKGSPSQTSALTSAHSCARGAEYSLCAASLPWALPAVPAAPILGCSPLCSWAQGEGGSEKPRSHRTASCVWQQPWRSAGAGT